jgi:hypothetical protein
MAALGNSPQAGWAMMQVKGAPLFRVVRNHTDAPAGAGPGKNANFLFYARPGVAKAMA